MKYINQTIAIILIAIVTYLLTLVTCWSHDQHIPYWIQFVLTIVFIIAVQYWRFSFEKLKV